MSRMLAPRDRQVICKLAAEWLVQGAVTVGYGANRQAFAELLNDALATEIVNTLRYRRDGFMAVGMHSIRVTHALRRCSDNARRHAEALAQRIVELGGAPDFAPELLPARNHSEYREGSSLQEMSST
ncbi:ferritin-like domain-containing protein [Mycetohabitans sp. B8]|uniref:ferritin-like domain-containing protein n=1 Tax=Mycetohabitans sp. B8 TaxID=2841845 RepID=UPI001F1BD7A0|nr:ferritin-like domain-containing protein [Mycetohabitans sp. B8]MCG1042122.1 ferritin-like domain-containing protein [Mycetohabitans sp. B8]